ncbi:ABC superfamily ATP binding cassette transporter, ABC protein [Companilactobacillus tucceti DSM 20183]|uniref:ABC superfamily ATP binding cassette transporter, ABC protein n=1 Tax=Companilactobacillus tucceti DSM 20183 TaxID=1423811 RepID=A0A0R1J0Y0_9LACO|nr:ATP-binding cassette domain-containing protein [Companilactobacillus tucceti]KRK64799.1 ABC superfamily ATP binding cassette transporter, ABC protein [Companilactobacillus tucceti DSM 20183]
MLVVQNVNTYIGQKRIITDASFKINPGNIIGLIGPNGAGKTTLMKTILGLTKFNGQILLNQTTVTENQHAALDKVGTLIEHPAIYPFLTGQQNLELYAHDPDDCQSLISKLNMNTYIHDKAKGYSLGMKQKLGIAIALLNKPQLVILDEPMNGLDVEATIIVRRLIHQYAAKGTAFLISSHILSELQKVMNQVILINHGHIIINQPIAEFEQLHHQVYKLHTNNSQLTVDLLKNHHIHYTLDGGIFQVNPKNIFEIQDILSSQHVYLKELTPISSSFEQIVVQLLNQQRGGDHYDD